MADAMRLLTMLADLDDDEKRAVVYVVAEYGSLYAMNMEQYTDMLERQTHISGHLKPYEFGAVRIGNITLDAHERLDKDEVLKLLGKLYVDRLGKEWRAKQKEKADVT